MTAVRARSALLVLAIGVGSARGRRRSHLSQPAGAEERRDPHDRPCRGPGRARSHACAHVRRPHDLHAHVPEALRHRLEAEHRSAARGGDAQVLHEQEDGDDQAAHRDQVQRRHDVRRRRREAVARPAQDPAPLGARERARAGDVDRHAGEQHRHPPPEQQVRADHGSARRPRGDDHVAEGAERPR